MAQLSYEMYEGYRIQSDPAFPVMKKIMADGSGTVPKVFRGQYTSFRDAKDHIDRVKSTLALEEAAKKRRKTKVEKPNAKADTTAGDEQVRKGADNGGESS